MAPPTAQGQWVSAYDNERILFMKSYSKMIIRIVFLILGAVLLILGLHDGGFRDVKNKAIQICYECMGIG